MESTRHQVGRGARPDFLRTASGIPAAAGRHYTVEMRDGAVHGAIAVIERQGRLLVIRRAEGIRAAGWWCFPGGAIEPGESAEQALVREVREELGLEVRPLEQLWEWERPDGQLVLHWWRAELTTDDCEWQLHPGEVAEARWVTPQQLRELRPVIENNLEFLRVCWPEER